MTEREKELLVLGDEIRRMRLNMGMTQDDAADALETDFRVISRYENGQNEMGALMYRQLLRLYERKTREDDLMKKIRALDPKDRRVLEMLIDRLAE